MIQNIDILTAITVATFIALIVVVFLLFSVIRSTNKTIKRLQSERAALRKELEIVDRKRIEERTKNQRLEDAVASYEDSSRDLIEENKQLKKDVVRAVNLLKSKVEDYELALEFERLKNLSK